MHFLLGCIFEYYNIRGELYLPQGRAQKTNVQVVREMTQELGRPRISEQPVALPSEQHIQVQRQLQCTGNVLDLGKAAQLSAICHTLPSQCGQS